MGIRNPVLMVKPDDLGRVVKRKGQEVSSANSSRVHQGLLSFGLLASSLYEQQSYRILCRSRSSTHCLAKPIFGPAAHIAQLVTIGTDRYLVASGGFVSPSDQHSGSR